MQDRFGEFRRALEGAMCLGLVAQAYGFAGELVSPVSVLYLGFAETRWARFGIDAGDFHWRETTSLEPVPGDGSGNTYPLLDVATTYPVVGHRIHAVELTRNPVHETTLTLKFGSGGVLTVVNYDDQTHLKYLAPAV